MKTIQRLALAVIALASLAYGQGSNGNNFGGGGGSGVTITNVAGLASVAGKTKGTIAVVTDGNSATDCTVGGGSNLVTCQYNGSTWSQLVASSSGGTAFSAITGSTNSTAAMVCSTGCSIAVRGSGTNQSTSLTGTPSITINALTATTINGAAFSGTFSGAPTFSGNIAFTGTPTFSNTLALNTSGTSGGLTGTPSITVNALSATTINGAALSGTFTGTPTFSGNVAFSGTPTFSNTLALNTSGNAGTSTTAANLTGCTGTATGDICYYNSGWTRLAGNASGTKFLQETSAGAISWATGGSAPSLDQVTGSAAQATGTETAAGHQYTFAGVETSNLTAPFSFTNANSTNNNTSIGLLAGVTGYLDRRHCSSLLRRFGHGRFGRFLLSGGSVSNGTYTVGTKEASIGATGNLALAGSLTTNSATNVCGSSSPCIGGVEGATGPTPTATDDFLFMSSTNHCIEGSYNAGALGCIPLGPTTAPTSGQIAKWGSNFTQTGIDFPETLFIPAANCNNTTAGAGWSIPSGGTVTCRAGTNNLGGYIAITDTSSTFAQFTLAIPFDWDSATLPYIRFQLAYPGTDGGSAHTIIPQVKVACTTATSGVSDDPSFQTAHSSSTITLSSATANFFFSTSNVQFNSTDMTGCVAGGLMIVQVGRATDTATSAANFYGATVTFPRLLTVQAN